jgi:glyoxylase-like metal-dependent hydrolase (beta-lactamase superfamily II)
VRAVSLHRDVIVVTSQLFQAHCTIVRAPDAAASGDSGGSDVKQGGAPAGAGGGEAGAAGAGEAFAIDSPVLPEELELLPSLVAQAGFPTPRGLLVTHADFDHVLAPLAFADATIGCAESSAARLSAEPGAQQRMLRRFDEELHIERPRPLSLGAIQALAVPGRCGIGEAELELHPATGHTADGMAVWIPWAAVLVAGDYLSPIEPPVLGEADGMLAAYLATLDRLRPLVAIAEHVVPGHGPVSDRASALRVLDEDVAYLNALREHGAEAELPPRRRARAQRELHAQNAARV